MSEGPIQFDNTTRRRPGKLAFGRDINRAIEDAQSGGRGVLPPEVPPGGFGFGDGSAWSRVFIIQVVNAEAGAGKYSCIAHDPYSEDLNDPDEDFASGALGSDEVEHNGLFINLAEYGRSTHGLTDIGGPPYFPALHTGYSKDGRMVFMATVYPTRTCSSGS